MQCVITYYAINMNICQIKVNHYLEKLEIYEYLLILVISMHIYMVLYQTYSYSAIAYIITLQAHFNQTGVHYLMY